MSNSEKDPSFEAGDLAEDFVLGCECALPSYTHTQTYAVVGRGKLPEDYPGATFVRIAFDPTKTRSPA